MKHNLLFLFTLLFSLGAIAQDDCANALVVSSGIYTVDIIDGTAPAEECITSGNTPTFGEWYAFTPDETNNYMISTSLGQNSGGDTRFNIYSGNCSSLTCIGGDDDSGEGYLSIASLFFTAGQTYYIVFDNAWSNAGFDFEIGGQTNGSLSFNGVSGVSGSVVVDMNNDMLDDVVNVNGNTLTINHQQPDGTLIASTVTTPDPDHSPSWSIAAGDIDRNGFTDLLYGGGSGVTFMFANEDGTQFTEYSGPEYVFSQRSNMVDINNDGNLDAFVCHDVQPNVYYLNDGNGNLTHFQGGLGDVSSGGNYGSIWVDYNNDGLIDLFIAKCRGGNSEANINEMHQNMGGGVFQDVSDEINLSDNIQTWSSAWGDFDNDGDMDVLIGASSDANGMHKLMENNDGMFTDATAGTGFDTALGTGIENCTHDFNNDGYLDVLGVGGNIMLNNGDMTFTETPTFISNGPVGDLNNDGHLDVVANGQMYLNAGNNNNYLRVHLEGVESNRDGIGARVEVVCALGTQIRDIRAGDGFRYMSSITAHFGIAENEEIEQVMIHWPSGQVDVLYNPAINSTLLVVEGSSTVGIDEYSESAFSIYPTIANDVLNINSPDVVIRELLILDALGKSVSQRAVTNTLDVSELASGNYILQARIGNNFVHRKFIKE